MKKSVSIIILLISSIALSSQGNKSDSTSDIYEARLKTIESKVFILEGQKETLLDLRITNDSLLTTKTNEIMKILTIVAFITFPLTLIAGIFGMNAKYMPFVVHDKDFFIILGLMVVTVFIMFAYFKFKKWM